MHAVFTRQRDRLLHLRNLKVHRARGHRRGLGLDGYVSLLSKTLEIGFHLVAPGRDLPVFCFDHTPHHDQMFETAFSSDNDQVITDAVCAWVADDRAPAGSFMRYFSGRVEKDTLFSPRLRQMSIRAIWRIWHSELTVTRLETVRLLLYHLNADVDDVEDKYEWVNLLMEAIRSPMGFGSLSSHYWCLLGKLVLITHCTGNPALRDVGVMRLLEEAESWERLRVWMVGAWKSLPFLGQPVSESITE